MPVAFLKKRLKTAWSEHVAEHEFAMLCRRGAYALDDAEDIVYEEELLVV
jgi:hypothetical protein